MTESSVATTAASGITLVAGVEPAAPADLVVQAVVTTPGVAGLGGSAAEATYLPGRRITGVRFSDEGVEVHVVLRWLPDLRVTTAAVQQAVEALGLGPVHVVVADVEGPDEVEGAGM